MAFVHEQQRIVGQVVEQARRRLAGSPPGQVARIVLDAGAVTELADHFDVEQRALLEPLGFEQLIRVAQHVELHGELGADLIDRREQRFARRHVMGLRENREPRHRAAAPRRSAGRNS